MGGKVINGFWYMMGLGLVVLITLVSYSSFLESEAGIRTKDWDQLERIKIFLEQEEKQDTLNPLNNKQ